MPTQLHADTHFSRTRTTAHASHNSCGSSVTRGQRLRFILRHVFALSSSFTSSLPDYFVFTTSTYFSTLFVLHVRSTEPVSIHKRTRSLEGVWPTGRLVSTHKDGERSWSTRKLVANTQIINTCKRFFQNVQKKLEVSNWCDILSGILQDQCIDVEGCYGIVEESCLTPWEGCCEEFGNPPEYEIRECWECLWYYSKNWFRNSLEKFWMWNAWDIHHHHERDEYWQMIRRSSGQRQEFFVYADSVLCLGQTEQGSGAAEKWKGKFEDIKMYSPYQDAVGIDGEAIELEWKIQDFSILSILQEIQKALIQKNIQPKEPNHLRVNGQRHLVEIRWSELHHKRRECEGLRVAVPSRTLDVSWSRLRARHGTEILTNNRDSGISQKIRWYNNSKKQDTLFFHRHQCFESRSSETKTKEKYHSLQ